MDGNLLVTILSIIFLGITLMASAWAVKEIYAEDKLRGEYSRRPSWGLLIMALILFASITFLLVHNVLLLIKEL